MTLTYSRLPLRGRAEQSEREEERLALIEAKKHLDTCFFICIALRVTADHSPGLKPATNRLKRHIDACLGGAATLGTWLEKQGIDAGAYNMLLPRHAWLDKMIEERSK